MPCPERTIRGRLLLASTACSPDRPTVWDVSAAVKLFFPQHRAEEPGHFPTRHGIIAAAAIGAGFLLLLSLAALGGLNVGESYFSRGVVRLKSRVLAARSGVTTRNS
jgi:hypothetical protein